MSSADALIVNVDSRHLHTRNIEVEMGQNAYCWISLLFGSNVNNPFGLNSLQAGKFGFNSGSVPLFFVLSSVHLGSMRVLGFDSFNFFLNTKM